MSKTDSEWDIDQEMRSLVVEKLRHDYSFKNVFRNDLTKQIMENLHKRMFSKHKTDHFIIVIRGCESITSTGVGKSSLGMEIGMMFDKTFNLNKIDFTNEELLKKIKAQAIVGEQKHETAQVFMRDESPDSLRRRSQVEFSIVQEALRDSRISLILIKPEPADLGLCHYIFEPLFFNRDFTKLKVCVVNPSTGRYRGFMNFEIHKNNPVWVEYMKVKKNFESNVVNRQVGAFIARDYAIKFMESVFYPNCYRMAKKDSHKIINVKRMKKYLNQYYSNLTNAERDYIIDDIKEIEEERTKK